MGGESIFLDRVHAIVMCGWIQHGPCSGSCMTCCACMILFAVCTLKKMGVTKCRWKGFGGGIQHAAHTAQQAHLLQPHPVMKGLEACFACSFVTAKPKRIPEPFSTRACKEQLVRFPCGVNMGMQAMNERARRKRFLYQLRSYVGQKIGTVACHTTMPWKALHVQPQPNGRQVAAPCSGLKGKRRDAYEWPEVKASMHWVHLYYLVPFTVYFERVCFCAHAKRGRARKEMVVVVVCVCVCVWGCELYV